MNHMMLISTLLAFAEVIVERGNPEGKKKRGNSQKTDNRSTTRNDSESAESGYFNGMGCGEIRKSRAAVGGGRDR
jgi:hypothetical protein